MTTGDQADMERRITATIPPSWFRENATVNALISGIANSLSFVYQILTYAKQQTRLKTRTHGWLDITSQDFLGNKLPRKANETDPSFSARIQSRILRETNTRKGMHDALLALTGNSPDIIEPRRPADTGGYGIGGCGYGVAGAYGSLFTPYQAFITVHRNPGTGVPFIAGYGSPSGGYGIPSRSCYANLDQVLTSVSNTDIYDLVNDTKPAGTICWVRIE